MDSQRKEISSYLENITLLLLGIFFILFPLLFATFTTDPFGLPKQVLLGIVAFAGLLIFGVKTLNEGRLRLRRTPFDVPLLLFTLATFVSTLVSLNRYDGLIAFVPLLMTVLLVYVIINMVKDEAQIFFLLGSLVLGASLSSIIALLSFLKIYILPFAGTNVRTFTPLGSQLDQAMYLALVLPIAGYIAYPFVKSMGSRMRAGGREIGFGIGFVVIAIGLLITLISLFTLQKPTILPFETGFQTAFAAISQDTGRVAQGFALGSGFGTYVTDFTRFKQPAFNTNQALWSLTFFRSSSFILELLATTGILGLLAFLFLLYRILRERPIFLPLIIAIAASLLLPFSFVIQTLFFVMVALFAAIQGLMQEDARSRFFDVEVHLVAFKRGFIALETKEHRHNDFVKVLPVIFFITSILVTALVGFFATRYVLSDVSFQNSLLAAQQNNGLKTYQEQANSINTFPYRDAYYRIFSQTNLALANSLAASQPKNSSPSAQTQQNIYTLIQQSINAGRTATTLSPLTALNWQNLSSVYRNLIGFGQNADAFAVLTNQQAIGLDPNNPQEYVNLGGIYYQLGQWDNAINQFLIAIRLKNDYANAYYNLGHAYEQKGDLQNALAQYQTVRTLVASDANNLKQINAEIDSLQKKIGKTAAENGGAQTGTGNQQPLEISTPSAQLPQQKTPVKIPSPPASSSAR